MTKLLGYQLTNLKGENIQGKNEDPTNMASFEIMAPVFASYVMRLMATRKFLLMPIYEGDIEDPKIIEGI